MLILKFDPKIIVVAISVRDTSRARVGDDPALLTTGSASIVTNPDIDVIVNLTIPAVHYEVTRKILMAGKHAYSEKPLVLTLAEGEDLRDLRRKASEAETFFRRTGITFNVYGQAEADERLIPFDIVPRIIAAKEWARLSKGVEQRVRAINAFLHDIYHRQEILRAGRVPVDLIAKNEAFLPQMMGVEGQPSATPEGKISPLERYGVKVISIQFFVPEGQPIVWRGPLVGGAIQQFLRDVDWGELDYLDDGTITAALKARRSL